jgi:hypothetical protein
MRAARIRRASLSRIGNVRLDPAMRGSRRPDDDGEPTRMATMETPTPRYATIVAVARGDESHAAVRKRAAALARQVGSTLILWAADAPISPLESPLPTGWSGDGEQEQFGDRLGPNDLMAAGREDLARQIGELRKEGVDAWAWLPGTADAEHLAEYAADQGATLVLVSTEDAGLIADLRDAEERQNADRDRSAGGQHVRVEAVPG